MNVAFIIPSLANKGPILVVKDLVSGLVQKQVNCKIFYFDEIEELEINCPTEKINFFSSIDFTEYDVIHSHGLRPDAYIYMHKPRKCNAYCISTLHSYIDVDLSYQYNKIISFGVTQLWKVFFSRIDHIAVLSKNAKKYYKSWFREDKLSVIHNSRQIQVSTIQDGSLDFEDQITSLKKDYTIIGVNALLTRIKGVDQLLKALPSLPTCALVVVGDGSEKDKLEVLVKEQNIEGRCLFLGYQHDAYRYLKFYDIYAMVSRSEGFPLALLEAAQSKIKTICSDIPIFRELFSEKDVSFFELENIDSLISSIQRLIKDDEKGDNLYKVFCTKYSMEIFVTSYINIYNRRSV